MWYLAKHSAEQEADRRANPDEVRISVADAYVLLDDAGYQQARGLLPGWHFRKERGEGCYHLRVHGHHAWLHWDRWDPRRHTIQHFFETPALWGTTAVAGTLVAAIILGRRSE